MNLKPEKEFQEFTFKNNYPSPKNKDEINSKNIINIEPTKLEKKITYSKEENDDESIYSPSKNHSVKKIKAKSNNINENNNNDNDNFNNHKYVYINDSKEKNKNKEFNVNKIMKINDMNYDDEKNLENNNVIININNNKFFLNNFDERIEKIRDTLESINVIDTLAEQAGLQSFNNDDNNDNDLYDKVKKLNKEFYDNLDIKFHEIENILNNLEKH